MTQIVWWLYTIIHVFTGNILHYYQNKYDLAHIQRHYFDGDIWTHL